MHQLFGKQAPAVSVLIFVTLKPKIISIVRYYTTPNLVNVDELKGLLIIGIKSGMAIMAFATPIKYAITTFGVWSLIGYESFH